MIGPAFYLIGCIITFFLLDKKKFDYVTIIFILLSWASTILAVISMKDKQYKQLEDKEK